MDKKRFCEIMEEHGFTDQKNNEEYWNCVLETFGGKTDSITEEMVRGDAELFLLLRKRAERSEPSKN